MNKLMKYSRYETRSSGEVSQSSTRSFVCASHAGPRAWPRTSCQSGQVAESDTSESRIVNASSCQIVENRLAELEAGVGGLKKRLEKRDTTSTASPALDRIQRSVRNVDAAIRDRVATIDDLAKRISSVRLATPARSREPSATPMFPVKYDTPVTTVPISFEAPPEIVAAVHDSMVKRHELKSRLEALGTARLSRVGSGAPVKGSVLSHASLIHGPIMIDALPLPGRVDTRLSQPDPVAPSESTDIKTEARPGFQGVKLSLDPGEITATSSSTRTSRGGTHRQHTPAARYISPGPSGAMASVTPTISFAPPLPLSGATNVPSGFFR